MNSNPLRSVPRLFVAGSLALLMVGVISVASFPARAQGARDNAPVLPEGGAEAWEAWLAGLRTEAEETGISPSTVTLALSNRTFLPRVIELDRSQPEFSLTFSEYMDRVVPPSRVEMARRKYEEHRTLFTRLGDRFGVQPRFLVALWGIETDFGRRLGTFAVLDSLATLAHDGRRSSYFKEELFDVLRIMDQTGVMPEDLVGSWAGAMGQLQFMPSSIRRNWVDYDGNGRLDIWSNPSEAVASGANYLARSGWRNDQTWGRSVTIPRGFPKDLTGLKVRKRLSEWQRLGVRRADGRDLPSRDLEASLIQAGDGDEPFYLVYDNFRALLTWNRSNYFALAVGRLSDQLRDLQ